MRDDPAIGPEHTLLASALVQQGGADEILTDLGTGFEQIEARINHGLHHRFRGSASTAGFA